MILAAESAPERLTLAPPLRRASGELWRSPRQKLALDVEFPAGSAAFEELREIRRRSGESR